MEDCYRNEDSDTPQSLPFKLTFLNNLAAIGVFLEHYHKRNIVLQNPVNLQII